MANYCLDEMSKICETSRAAFRTRDAVQSDRPEPGGTAVSSIPANIDAYASIGKRASAPAEQQGQVDAPVGVAGAEAERLRRMYE